jgi:hypothetical protein
LVGELVQQIGAYAGIASVAGLAVLASLYFAHARELRQLRQWADEFARAVAQREAERVRTVQPVRSAPLATPTAVHVARSSAAASQAAGQPAGAVPATPAAAEAARTAAGAAPAAAQAGGGASDVGAPAEPAAPTEAGAGAATASGAPAPEVATSTSGNGATPPHGRPTITIRSDTPPLRHESANVAGAPGTSAADETMIMRGGLGEQRGVRRLAALAPRRLLAVAVLVLALVAIAGVAGSALLNPPSRETSSTRRTGSDGTSKQAARPIVPSQITVAVLNGTTVPGLAAQIGDRLSALGFDVGNITNNSDQQRAESVVLFQPGHEREAAFVGRKLGIAQREPIDPVARQLGGDASVVVIAGADQTP